MQAYTELIPPTAVTHAVTLPLLGPNATNLVVAKTSLLQIFQVKPHVETTNQKGEAAQNGTSEQVNKLVFVAEYPISGTITSLASVDALNTKSGGKALLVSTKDAKISLVEWDPEQHSLATISIHYYEDDDLQGSPWAPSLGQCTSYLTVDPSSRCAALKFGLRSLALLPFRQLGDDLVLDDYDLEGIQTQQPTNGTHATRSETRKTPYSSSFVLTLTALDPGLLHLVHLSFLHEYREPTIGILSSSRAPSQSLLPERTVPLSYSVFTLDLEQRARTQLLSVPGLPSDLFKLVPLPLPVGGALLIGGNELIHVDQAGKTNAVAVNPYGLQSKNGSKIAMHDQSGLYLKLEECIATTTNRQTGDVLLILNTGEMATVNFRIDGRSVSGVSVRLGPTNNGDKLLDASASCVVAVDSETIFVGSNCSDSVLLNVPKERVQVSRKRSHAEMTGANEDASDEDMDDEDDLYGANTSPTLTRTISTTLTDGAAFSITDKLPTLVPAAEPTFGKRRRLESEFDGEDAEVELDMVLPTGKGESGGLAFLQQKISLIPTRRLSLPSANDHWCLNLVKPNRDEDETHEITMIIASKASSSAIYLLSESELFEKTGTDFEGDRETIDAGTLCRGSRLVQVLKDEIRCLDADLGLAQIVPMADEESEAELQVQSACFCDPYLLLIRSDESAIVLEASKNGELEEVDRSGTFASSKWRSGCIYKPDGQKYKHLVFQLSNEGHMRIYSLSSLQEPIYITHGLPFLPPNLSNDHAPRRTLARESLEEILVADVGDSVDKCPHLMVRTSKGHVAAYTPYHYPSPEDDSQFTTNLRWSKVRNQGSFHLAHKTAVDEISLNDEQDDEGDENMEGEPTATPFKKIFTSLQSTGDRSSIFVRGPQSALLLKEASSQSRFVGLHHRGLQSIDCIRTEDGKNECLLLQEGGEAIIGHFASNARYGDTGWMVERRALHEDVNAIAYHASSGLYVLGTSLPEDFQLPEDDWHHEWAKEELLMSPQVDRGAVKLYDRKKDVIIQEIQLEPQEVVMCIKSLSLQISERTRECKNLIVVGTAIVRGEDLACGGAIYVYDIIPVVPDPERPETNRALKEIVREEVKGPVTALSSIGSEGFLIAAQGQKCLVRGLKEDNSLLPVAFMDMQCYVTAVKNLPQTGLVLQADAVRGVWLSGYSEGPYRLRLFGKSKANMEIMAAEFLPDDKQLFIPAVDSQCDLHVYEFNPEHPQSLSGQRLLHKSTFHTGHFPTSMTLLPSTRPSNKNSPPDAVNGDSGSPPAQNYQVLIASQSGALALLTPLPEDKYRTLTALQTYLSTALEHPCGLNPRAYRSVESDGIGGRGVLDGGLLRRWWELGSQRRAEAGARVGAEDGEVANLLETFGGSGLGYL